MAESGVLICHSLGGLGWVVLNLEFLSWQMAVSIMSANYNNSLGKKKQEGKNIQ